MSDISKKIHNILVKIAKWREALIQPLHKREEESVSSSRVHPTRRSDGGRGNGATPFPAFTSLQKLLLVGISSYIYIIIIIIKKLLRASFYFPLYSLKQLLLHASTLQPHQISWNALRNPPLSQSLPQYLPRRSLSQKTTLGSLQACPPASLSRSSSLALLSSRGRLQKARRTCSSAPKPTLMAQKL